MSRLFVYHTLDPADIMKLSQTPFVPLRSYDEALIGTLLVDVGIGPWDY